MSNQYKAYRVKFVTVEDVVSGVRRDEVLFLHSQDKTNGSLYWFVRNIEDTDGFAMLMDQMVRCPENDVDETESPGTEMVPGAAVESVPVQTPEQFDMWRDGLPDPTDTDPEYDGYSHAQPKALGVNPKDLVGQTKADISLVPSVGIAHTAHAMMDGARKYGPYNWRGNSVKARVYVAAAMRHLMQWLDGEEVAEDSGTHHLGHAAACCMILMDAQAFGNLHDDRPSPVPLAEQLANINKIVMEKQQ